MLYLLTCSHHVTLDAPAANISSVAQEGSTILKETQKRRDYLNSYLSCRSEDTPDGPVLQGSCWFSQQCQECFRLLWWSSRRPTFPCPDSHAGCTTMNKVQLQKEAKVLNSLIREWDRERERSTWWGWCRRRARQIGKGCETTDPQTPAVLPWRQTEPPEPGTGPWWGGSAPDPAGQPIVTRGQRSQKCPAHSLQAGYSEWFVKCDL